MRLGRTAALSTRLHAYLSPRPYGLWLEPGACFIHRAVGPTGLAFDTSIHRRNNDKSWI